MPQLDTITRQLAAAHAPLALLALGLSLDLTPPAPRQVRTGMGAAGWGGGRPGQLGGSAVPWGSNLERCSVPAPWAVPCLPLTHAHPAARNCR